jgi:hypothetical protein
MSKIKITLYEFYAMGINTLLKKAPWENETQFSPYRESFLFEQRLLGLTILYLLGEEYVPESVLKTMPSKYGDQVRDSVNTAVFLRALKHHLRHSTNGDARAEHILRRMDSYVRVTRESRDQDADPLEAITMILSRRVPPMNQEQFDKYEIRVKKIFNYTEALVKRSLTQKYDII